MEEAMHPLDLCLPKPQVNTLVDGTINAPLDLCLSINTLSPSKTKSAAVSGEVLSECPNLMLDFCCKKWLLNASNEVNSTLSNNDNDVPYLIQNTYLNASIFLKVLKTQSQYLQGLNQQQYLQPSQSDATTMRGKENTMQMEISLKKYDHEKHIPLMNPSYGEKNHSTEDIHFCLVCGGSFLTFSSLSLHMKEHIDELACKECGVWFTNEFKLKRCCKREYKNRHLRKSHNSLSWKCSVCNTRFLDPEDLDEHIKFHTEVSQITSVSIYEQKKGDKVLLESSQRPRLQDKLGSREKSNIYFKNSRKYVDDSGDLEGKFKCNDCGKTFARGRNVQIHRNYGRCPVRRDAKIIFACSDCGKKFRCEKDLVEHKVEHFSMDAKGFPCQDCGKVFFRKTALHIHTGSRRCTGVQREDRSNNHCPECGIVFKFRAHLVEHMVKHTGERAFQCAGCGKWFARARNVKMHVQRGSCVGLLSRNMPIEPVT